MATRKRNEPGTETARPGGRSPFTTAGKLKPSVHREKKRAEFEVEAGDEAVAGHRASWDGGYAIVLNQVIESRTFQLLTKNEILVYLRLCGCYNHGSGRCDPGQRTIADRVGLDRTTVTRANGKLVAAGLLRRVPYTGSDARKAAYAVTAFENAGPRPDRDA